MALRVLVDANVLYSRTLRDWLFLLRNHSQGDLYTVHGTEDILAEVLYRYRRHHPNAPGQLTASIRERIVDSLDSIVREFAVAEPPRPGADPHDAHVHAAAIACEASILLTDDGGFTDLADHGDTLPYEVHTPDSFFLLVDDALPQVVRSVTAEQYAYWRLRPEPKPLDTALERARCPSFAARVRAHLAASGLTG